MNRERLEDLIAQAIANCYDEYDEYVAMLATLQSKLHFPIPAYALAEPVVIVGIDEGHSNIRRGIMVAVQRENDDYSFPLAELQVGRTNEHNAEWIAAYRLWRQ